MERTFHLTNEFRLNGPEQLAAILCASRQVVTWGPVFPLVRGAYNAKRSLLSPKGFIQLLERDDGPLRVMARGEWLTDPAFRRRYRWEPARTWQNDFDGEICRLALEDSRKPPGDRRVIISGPEHGWQRAAERLAQPDRTKVLRGLRTLYSRRQLPPGVLQRTTENEAIKNRHPAETILRDIFNHEDAVNESGSSISALDPTYASFVENLGKLGVEFKVPIKPSQDSRTKAMSLQDVEDLLHRVAPITNEKNLLRFLGSADHRAFRQMIYLNRDFPLRPRLLQRLISAEHPEPLLTTLFSSRFSGDIVSKTVNAWELASLVVSLITLPLRPWRLVPLATRFTQASLQRLGILPLQLGDQHSDLQSLFYLCFATRRPTRRDLQRLIASLRDEIQEAD